MRVGLTFSVFRVELVESKGNDEVSIRMPETINAIPHIVFSVLAAAQSKGGFT